jgi:hypothetical protein
VYRFEHNYTKIIQSYNLKRLPRVLYRGIYILSSTIDENYDRYIQSSNPVRSFVEKAVRGDENGAISKQDMYDAYMRFCTDKKLGVESEQSFSRKLKKEHGLNDMRMSKGGRPYIWTGVRLIDWKKPEDEDQSTL